MPRPITLKVYRGDALVKTEQFNRDIIKIGRLASAHLVLDDEKISRIHSVIEVAPDGNISIIDMGSAEGTFVNGKKVSRGKLFYGDEVTLGGLRLVLEPPAGTSEKGPAAGQPPARTTGVNRAIAMPETGAAPKPGAQGLPRGKTNGKARTTATSLALASAEMPAPVAARPKGAFVTTVPAVIEDLSSEPDLGVELRVLWGQTILDVGTFVRPKVPVYLGDTDRCAMRFEGLPLRELPVLKFANGEYRFTFTKGMNGVVVERDSRRTFGELVREKKAAPESEVNGAYSITVPKAGQVRAEVGTLAIEAGVKVPRSLKSSPFWERVNYRVLNLFLVLFFIQAGFIVAANNWPYNTDIVADDLFKNPQQMAKFIIKPPDQPPPVGAPAARAEEKKDEGEAAERAKGEEGQMGKKDAPKTNGRSAPKAIDPSAKELVKRTGLLAALGRGGGSGLSTVMGNGLGGDVRGAVGNMFGPVVGDSYGLGGLGIRGSGSGGGGSGETIGIGAVGTKGRGGGMGSYGTGVGGLGAKSDRPVNVQTGNAVVMGSIDKELIRKVIQEHAAQILFCYEQQLALNPRLQGKVSVKWVINADGSASSPQIDASATTLDDPKVHECMMARITSWLFPKPKGGGIAVITYPWILRATGAE